MSTTQPTVVDQGSLSRAQRAALPLSTEVAQVIAEQHGVCVRPLAMRRIDTTTGRIDVVPVPADPPARINAARVRIRRGGCGWPSAERAGTSLRSQPSSGPRRVRNSRS